MVQNNKAIARNYIVWELLVHHYMPLLLRFAQNFLFNYHTFSFPDSVHFAG